MNTNEITWSDGLGNRSRSAFLFFVKGDEVIPFNGETIQGVVVIKGSDYTKNGRWSHNSYRLQLAKGIRHIAGRSGWETGRFVEGLGAAVSCPTPDTWAEVAQAIGISVPGAMDFLRSWRPKAAEALDKVEESLMELEDSSDSEEDFETVTISFGSPTNRQIRDGYWESPKPVPGYKAEVRLIDPEKGWQEGNIEVDGISGTVLSVKHSAGMHGGYYAISVAVVPGTEEEIPAFQTAREKAGQESDFPELFVAFNGDKEKIEEFMAKVEKLDGNKLDAHEMSCGRDRKKSEVVRVSGDQEFFLGADPLKVCEYILKNAKGSFSVGIAEAEAFKSTEPAKSFSLTDLAAKFGN